MGQDSRKELVGGLPPRTVPWAGNFDIKEEPPKPEGSEHGAVYHVVQQSQLLYSLDFVWAQGQVRAWSNISLLANREHCSGILPSCPWQGYIIR